MKQSGRRSPFKIITFEGSLWAKVATLDKYIWWFNLGECRHSIETHFKHISSKFRRMSPHYLSECCRHTIWAPVAIPDKHISNTFQASVGECRLPMGMLVAILLRIHHVHFFSQQQLLQCSQYWNPRQWQQRGKEQLQHALLCCYLEIRLSLCKLKCQLKTTKTGTRTVLLVCYYMM